MLTPSDYEHLKLLYERFRKTNLYIKELIASQNFDDADSAIQEKESILRQIIFFEKPRLKDIKENAELNKIRLELIELEKNNIELIKTLKEELLKQFTDIKKTKKVINAYEPSLSESFSTIDIKED